MSEPPLKGYQTKPLAISILAVAFFLIPLAIPIHLFLLAGGSWSLVGAVLRSGYFLEEWALSWSAALAVYLVSKWSFAYFLILSSYALGTKFVRLAAHSNLETPFTLFVTCFWFAVVIYFLFSDLKAPYLHPKLRWWTRPRRVGLSSEATLLYQGQRIPVVVLNLSEGGAFAKLGESVATGQKFPQRLGEEFDFLMALRRADLLESQPVRFESRGKLVWKAEPDSPYRSGMGIQFISVSKEQKRRLKEYLRHAA